MILGGTFTRRPADGEGDMDPEKKWSDDTEEQWSDESKEGDTWEDEPPKEAA